jgi:U3 small nucleolar RNA-associated protein 13
MELFTGSTDSRVRVYDLRDANARVVGGGGVIKPMAVLEGHVSVVRGIDVSKDGRWAVTGGRDKVVLVYDLEGDTTKKNGKAKAGPKLVQTMMAMEQVEALGLLPIEENVEGAKGRLVCYTAGDGGKVRLWDVLKAEELSTMVGLEGVDEAEPDEDEQRGIIDVL